MQRANVMRDGLDTELRAADILPGSLPVDDSHKPGIAIDGKAFLVLAVASIHDAS